MVSIGEGQVNYSQLPHRAAMWNLVRLGARRGNRSTSCGGRRSGALDPACGEGLRVRHSHAEQAGRRRLAVSSLLAGLLCCSGVAWSAPSVQVLIHQPRQIIDGFGTCVSGQDGDTAWFRSLFFDDLRCSVLRIDLTPRFVSPFSDDAYHSPVPSGRLGAPEAEESNVRAYTGPSDYGRVFAGQHASIAVMGPDIEQNLRLFDFAEASWKTAGQLAQLGAGKKTELGDFKLVGSVWSPAPWLKVASGDHVRERKGPLYPKVGTAWPFIWNGNFAGGRFDASGIPRSEFDDSKLGGAGPTSAIVQFARALAAEVRGFQRAYRVHFYAISLQNELNFETYYNSCAYGNAADYVAVLTAVRQEFDKYEDLEPVLIMGPEDLIGDAYGLWQLGKGARATHKNLQYLAAVAREHKAAAGLAFFAIHGYAEDGVTSAGADPGQWHLWADGWGDSPVAGLPSGVAGFRSYGKKSWMTETSGEVPSWLAPPTGFPGEGALGLALRIHQALTAGQQSAWLYWQLSNGRPVSDETLTDVQLGADSAKYVAAKHFFAAIRPGARRMETRVGDASTILASSYLHVSDGTLVLVLINLGAANQTVNVEVPSIPRGIRSFQVWTSAAQKKWQSTVFPVTQGQLPLALPGYGVATLLGSGQILAEDGLGSLPDIPPGSAENRGSKRSRVGLGGLVLGVSLLAAVWVLIRRRR